MDNKRKNLVFIIAFILVIAGVLVFILSNQNQVENVNACNIDADCVPASCCHATSCVPKGQAPDCSAALCSQECVPGTLDCGQATCSCQNQKCVVKKS